MAQFNEEYKILFYSEIAKYFSQIYKIDIS